LVKTGRESDVEFHLSHIGKCICGSGEQDTSLSTQLCAECALNHGAIVKMVCTYTA